MDRVVSGGHSEEGTFKLRAKEKPEAGEWRSMYREQKLQSLRQQSEIGRMWTRKREIRVKGGGTILMALQGITWEHVENGETQVPPQASKPESSVYKVPGQSLCASEIKQHWFREPLKSSGVICFIVFEGSL